MKKINFLFGVLIILIPTFFSCTEKNGDHNSYLNLHDVLITPFDTAKVLTMMKIVDSVNEVSKYSNETNSELYPKIDTLDLRDMRFACDCPHWRYADSSANDNFSRKDFYIEPADDKLKLPDCLSLGRIQFIGREYGGIGYPKNPQFEDPHPPMGRVFRYYAYKIYKPFTVWGPVVKGKTSRYDEVSELTVK